MKPGIRAKLIAVLLLASVVPLTLGILSLEFFGYRVYHDNQGAMYQAAAAYRAQSLSSVAKLQVEKLVDWTVLDKVDTSIKAQAGATKLLPPPQRVEDHWSSSLSSNPTLARILDNPLSLQLREFQRINPLFREILVTNADGLLIAATNKTSDYIQSDEDWWQHGSHLQVRQAWLDGISYDESADVYSLDITIAIRDDKGLLAGVMKGVLNASAMFSASPRLFRDSLGSREVVMNDGKILARLNDSNYQPLSVGVTRDLMDKINAAQDGSSDGVGWMVSSYDSQSPARTDMVGYAPLRVGNPGQDGIAIRGLKPMYLFVHEDTAKVFAPIRSQLLWLGVMGGILAVGFALAGLYLAQRQFIFPLQILGKATHSLAQTASYDDGVANLATHQEALIAVQQCQEVSTGDEIEQLARDFALMGDRVLRYHEHMQREIAAKTGEIQRDLEMAREFQEALLPTHYPLVPEGEGGGEGLRLQFHHIYQPAMSVGGDFFDVFKLSEHQAGIFIADVMGHGARSALVTAILRTLLQDLPPQQSDPAEILKQINRHFYTIMQGSRQFVFVSAFCLVIDARYRVATYASAGHPSPLLAESSTGNVYTLLDDAVLGNDGRETDHTNAALGLAYDSSYYCHSRAVQPGDSFLLYTDGVVEAPNANGEEFGMSRLERVVARQLRQSRASQDVASLSRSVMDAVNEWMQGIPSPDDICLVVAGASDLDQDEEPHEPHFGHGHYRNGNEFQ